MIGRSQGFFLLVVGALLNLVGPPESIYGQVPDSLEIATGAQEADTTLVAEGPRRITPRAAFIRSALVPGWGHAGVGAHVRGGFYFTIEASAAVMIFKTQQGINSTRNKLAVREGVLTARLQAEGITDPNAIEAALEEDPEVEDLRALEVTRSGQREDWIALGLFMMLIGGVDAYVSAHLADFPTAVVIDPSPVGGMEIGFSLPVKF